jgi:hypothetical protein
MSMNETVPCIRCHAQMEVGCVRDATESGWAQQIWHRGKPQRSWRGLTGNRGRRQSIRHSGFRGRVLKTIALLRKVRHRRILVCLWNLAMQTQ